MIIRWSISKHSGICLNKRGKKEYGSGIRLRGRNESFAPALSVGRRRDSSGLAIGTDFSPVLIDAARREAKNYLGDEDQRKVEFQVAKNETLTDELSVALGKAKSELMNSFHFVLGVNTIRYCHRAGKELDCAQDLFSLLVPGGMGVVIDMNDRFPAFRSAMRKKLVGEKENDEECYLPSLKEYTEPFAQAGFEVLRSEHFCWIPHSGGSLLTGVLRSLSPILSTVAGSRAMRSLVVAKKPAA